MKKIWPKLQSCAYYRLPVLISNNMLLFFVFVFCFVKSHYVNYQLKVADNNKCIQPVIIKVFVVVVWKCDQTMSECLLYTVIIFSIKTKPKEELEEIECKN